MFISIFFMMMCYLCEDFCEGRSSNTQNEVPSQSFMSHPLRDEAQYSPIATAIPFSSGPALAFSLVPSTPFCLCTVLVRTRSGPRTPPVTHCPLKLGRCRLASAETLLDTVKRETFL